MNALRTRLSNRLVPAIAALSALAVTPAFAQVPVDDSGAPLADYESFEPDMPAGNEDIPLLTGAELQELVGPIALYPDDLLAIVLPASTYPLQVVQAQRFLEELEQDPSLEPDEAWDDSVIALLNYPEVLQLLNEDLDWTWRLGEAVVAQQADVVGAVESFRDRAYAAGNLKSDSHQTVARNDGSIEITPVEDDVIYVPYYEPESVVVYQTRPAYRYYPRAYPVYYYPYPVGHAFNSGFFWGVTTAFTVGWLTDSVHVIHHSYHGHPYYGRHYWDGWWYRRPTIHVHNHYYSGDRYSVSRHRYSRGDHWQPRHQTRRRLHNQRITQSSYYAGRSVRHRSYSGTATAHDSARNLRRTRDARPLRDRRQIDRTRSVSDDRRQSNRTRSVRDNRRHERQAAVPAQTRQAPRRADRPDRSHERPQRARIQARQAQPERGPEHRERSRTQRRQQTTTRRDHVAAERQINRRTTEQRRHRASDNRQQARASKPQRQEPSQSGQKRSREKTSTRNAEPKRHASTRSDSRRQRH
jgi:hypothetical protein